MAAAAGPPACLSPAQLETCARVAVTAAELRCADGSADAKLWVCLRGVVYDVGAGRDFYGPGGGYQMFAGRDVSRNLATMKFDEEMMDVGHLDGLTEEELKTLAEWEAKFASKYVVVGRLAGSETYGW